MKVNIPERTIPLNIHILIQITITLWGTVFIPKSRIQDYQLTRIKLNDLVKKSIAQQYWISILSLYCVCTQGNTPGWCEYLSLYEVILRTILNYVM